MLIDAHVHVWDPHERAYTWLDGTAIRRPMLPSEYDRGGAEVDRVFFVQAADPEVDPVEEALWVNTLDWPQLVGIVAAANLADAPGAVREQLTALAAVDRVVGVRHLLQETPVTRFSEISEGLRILSEFGGTFDACIRHHQLPALLTLLRPLPDLTVVLDHVGKPPVDAGITSPEGREWARNLALLAERPATFVKLSGLTAESSDRALYEAHADAFLRHALDVFGAERALLASDWPVSTFFGVGGAFLDWSQRVGAVSSAEEWEQLSSAAAMRAYLPEGRSAFATPTRARA